MARLSPYTTFPHFISDALRLDKYSSVLCLNTCSGNLEIFLKRNIRCRIFSNTFFPGAYELCLAVIEGDEFLLTAVDTRRIMQLAHDLDFDASDVERIPICGLNLPKPLWSFFDECKKLPLSGDTIYHRANLYYLLWHIGRFYVGIGAPENSNLTQRLSWVVGFYITEVKRAFRSNREVNEAYFRIRPDELVAVPAKVLIVDLPPFSGHKRLPPHMLIRELVVDPSFSLEKTFPPETYLGSNFATPEALLGTLYSYLQYCEHIEYWVVILREDTMAERVLSLFAEKGRKNTLLNQQISGQGEFSFIISQKA